ncbi:chromate transporter [Litoreibacter halocynthiae]|uniref:Chromate transporter n=1 Tax=Litoreibacter halocynthiae TaxID=1242689 RepID=A0A4R7LUU0_9RHOB|nr:chromate efflux transporter [Litoreibacter halocynthiae]TDT78010.1 chromate transporter [Litoreibacter halocynthiae]
MTTLSEMIRVFGRIGLLSFGGPAAQIALMHKELVEDRPWLTEAQFLRALSFCMLLPGPEAMQLATFSGWRMRGITGGLLAGLLFVVPGALVIMALALAYGFYGQLPLVQSLFIGVKACVVVIVIQALIKVAKKALNGPIHYVIAAASFLALFALNAPFPLVIVIAACVGALTLKGEAEGGAPAPKTSTIATLKTVALWLVIWFAPVLVLALFAPGILVDMAKFFSTLAVVTFGGAYAVLAYMTQAVVGDFGWLTTAQMVDALGLAETTPGPLILVTQFVAMVAGFKAGGIGLALVAGLVTLWVTFAPCFLWIFAGAPYIDRLAHMPRLSGALSAITAAVVGVIANLGLWFAGAVFFEAGTAQPVPVVIAAIAAALLLWRKWDMLLVLPICAALGLVLVGGA